MPKNEFVLIGAAGYIAPRHMAAIQATGNELTYACDISDSVGVLDRFFPNCNFVLSVEELSENLRKESLNNQRLPRFLTICTPNHFHIRHISFGLIHGMDVICEKPLALTIEDLKAVEELEQKYGRRVYCILQLRLHPQIQNLKKEIEEEFSKTPLKEKLKVRLKYVTSRGPWYKKSWKYDVDKSGGIVTNIGIHLFDMLIELFGFPTSYSINEQTSERLEGSMVTPRAEIDFLLSINKEDLPSKAGGSSHTSCRQMTINGIPIDFTNGFTDLHTKSYEEILCGRGFGLKEAKAAVMLCESIRIGRPLSQKTEK